MKNQDQLYFLSPHVVQKVLVRKASWTAPRELNMETLEISPRRCHFEWVARREFALGEVLEFSLYLPDGPLIKKGAILSCEEYRFLDEDYHDQIWFSYQVRFDGDLDKEFLKAIVAAPRKCKSLF